MNKYIYIYARINIDNMCSYILGWQDLVSLIIDEEPQARLLKEL